MLGHARSAKQGIAKLADGDRICKLETLYSSGNAVVELALLSSYRHRVEGLSSVTPSPVISKRSDGWREQRLWAMRSF